MLGASSAGSFGNSRIRLRAGFPIRASAVRPGRDNEPVVREPSQSDRYRSACSRGFPRTELIDSSSFFIVWSFLSRLDFGVTGPSQ